MTLLLTSTSLGPEPNSADHQVGVYDRSLNLVRIDVTVWQWPW
jgi:hypothetical protein